ncbi:MAG: gamma-glutamylcyclotransferase [Pseudomonadota bacterium]
MDDRKAAEGYWVFAYGSLMWNPGFDFGTQVLARLEGYCRSFCMASVVYRGTPEAPGLVLALDKTDGAVCTGVGYQVAPESGVQTLAYLRERELVSSAYQEEVAPIKLADGREVQALCYVMDRSHEQYRGGLTEAEQAAVIARAAGPAGSNREYLMNTVVALHRLGLSDPELESLAAVVRRML